MRRFVALAVMAFVALVCSLCVAQQESPTSPIPTKTEAQAHDYSQEPYVIESYRTFFRFEKDGTGTKETTARVKVQSEAGVRTWGQLALGYNAANEKLEFPYIRVLKADGSTVNIGPDAVQDLTIPILHQDPVYTDYRQRHVTVPSLRPGDTLEYRALLTMETALAPGQFWMEYEFDKQAIVLDEQVEVQVPSARSVNLKTRSGFEDKVTEKDGQKIYHWSSSNLERDPSDPEKSAKKAKPSTKPLPPAIQLTTFSNWTEIGKWYGSLESDRHQVTPEIQKKAEQLTAGKSGDIERIKALYDFVAVNFRYVSLSFGLGRYQPHASTDVLRNQYGDCKDKNVLLASLLKAVGFHPATALVNSFREIDPDVPSPSQFNHVITVVPLVGDEVWMDTTTEVAPFRLLAYGLRNKRALVIRESGESALETVPANPPMEEMELRELNAVVSNSGVLEGKVHLSARGDLELLLRQVFRGLPSSRWNTFIENLSKEAGLDGQVSDVNVGDPTATDHAFELSWKVSKADYLDWSKQKLDVLLPFSKINIPQTSRGDKDPVPLGAPGDRIFRIHLELPQKYTVRPPIAISVKRDYAEYYADYRMDGTVFTGERKLVLKSSQIPSEKLDDYGSFKKALTADMGQRLGLETSLASTAPPTDLKPEQLNGAGMSAIDRGDYKLAIELLERAVNEDPKHKWAWNNLGRAYLDDLQFEKAVAAFQKQIEINPYDEYAYNNLGRTYRAQHNYEKAEASFLKQLDVNPLDKYAHGNLASLYLDWKKYTEAERELEKAISLAPQNAELQVDMGKAYLGLGDDARATSAFEKAISISDKPGIWNEIAYGLALKKVHLDKALQYAETAVTSAASASRNISLDSLNDRDAGITAALMSYWDTIGWVYFSKGDFGQAEKYIRAAWTGLQASVVGDHLGQIYESKGLHDAALRTYGMALASIDSGPEEHAQLVSRLGGDAPAEAAAKSNRAALDQMRRAAVPNNSKQDGKADFILLFRNTEGGAQVEGVKFVSGEEKLRSFVDILAHATYEIEFPDQTASKILRRGTLSCEASSPECKFVMEYPVRVRSVK